MKRIDSINDITTATIVAKQQSFQTSMSNGSFSSLLNQEKERQSNEESQDDSSNLLHQDNILQNQAYLNKLYLFSNIT